MKPAGRLPLAVAAGITLCLFIRGEGLRPRAEERQNVGPKVGEPAPAFRLPDQNGEPQTLDSIKGERGTILVFFRSADW